MRCHTGSEWRFSFSFGGGAKLFFTDNIGIRLQGRLFIPLYFNGGYIYGGGSGGGIALSGGAYLIQGDLTAGLIFAL